MNVRRLPLVLLAIVLAAVLNAYLFFQAAVQKISASGKVSIENECTDPSGVSLKKENPNKMLFISCGGFLE